MNNLPAEYVFLQNTPATIALRKDYKNNLIEQGSCSPADLAGLSSSSENNHRGRGNVPSIPIKDRPDEKMVIRKYLRGGLFRFINRDIYLGSGRPFRELAVTVAASSKNIPTPEVLAAVSIKVLGPFYRGYLITKELSSFHDLPSCIKTLSQNREESFSNDKEILFKKVADAVRLMHDRGFYHGDLNMKNILINTFTPKNICIIDWDKSLSKGSLSRSCRGKNVRRFCRSMTKLALNGLPVTESDQHVFLNSYWQNSREAKKDLLRLNISLTIRKPFWSILKKP